MERNIGTISAIKVLGYPKGLCVRECLCDELPCPLLTWLVSELRGVCPELNDRKGDIVLVGELKDLLANMLCPLTMLTSDVLEPALLNKVTEFLVSELQAAHILQYRELHPDDKTIDGETEKGQRVEDHNNELCQENEDGEVSDESTTKAETSAELTILLQALNIEPSSQYTDVLHEVESRLALLPCGDTIEPLLKNSLNSDQWRQVEKINQVLSEDYLCRRQMMVKRFEVTLRSFAWGEKATEYNDVLASVPPLSSFALSSQVSLSHLLAARQDQSCVLPVRAGPSTAVHKVLMGSVPDRGGRPGEIEPPMPSWQGRREKGKGSGGRGGGRRKFSEKKKKGNKE
ncbi:protein FAM98A [Polymixia lowei]